MTPDAIAALAGALWGLDLNSSDATRISRSQAAALDAAGWTLVRKDAPRQSEWDCSTCGYRAFRYWDLGGERIAHVVEPTPDRHVPTVAPPLDAERLARVLAKEKAVRGVSDRYGRFNQPYWDQFAAAIAAAYAEDDR